ncbi:UBC-like protein [Xylona heveae TC161]|uniref:UBC-like protein n=1 Tax=Xylona heveae (strain CBS 132557 / TC161) TaxID=1328760 RepID=A0A165ILQ6_XYLHT|nr:UBC-like protein [Xylona heveae TC161]KZF25078.1 UBC-like protein [Xylona heveae TC161]
MSAVRAMQLPSARSQHLVIEFARVKSLCPAGVYLTIEPGDPSRWTGILFVRKGPYAPAILRFQISFPSAYPAAAPRITFISEIFHPLLTPLTTYTYTTGSSETGTVSATDEERLPPGGFSLRHGFPQWFSKARDTTSTLDVKTTSANNNVLQEPQNERPAAEALATEENGSSPNSPRDKGSLGKPKNERVKQKDVNNPISIVQVLLYVRSTFDDAEVLDSVPLEAAGNSGAWHAWRSHRRALHLNLSENATPDTASPISKDKYSLIPRSNIAHSNRRPGEWNWEGVWEERVKRGIDASISEPVLYGNAAVGNDLIRFLRADDDMIMTLKEGMKGSMRAATA